MSCRLITTIAAAVSALLAVALPSAYAEAASDIRSVPPAEYRGNAPTKQASLLQSTSAPARRIDFAAPDAAEAAPMKSYNATGASGSDGKGHPLAIGFGRELPAAKRTIPLSALTWIAAPDGGRTARIEIASPGAAALRVALVLPAAHPDIFVRFAGSAAGATDYPVNAIAEESMRSGLFWSPVLAGDTAIIEFHAAADASIADVALRIPRISHMLVTGADLNSSTIVTKVTGIGAAGACEVDIACVTPASPAVLNLARAVAKLQFVGDDGRSFLCSGALLNDSVQSFTPYLLSASHCLESDRIARTLNTFWFYDAVACNSKATPPYVQLTGGAMLLGRSQDRDWSIVRLLDTPPAGTQFAAWRAEAVPVGTPVATIHHPMGDLMKWSVGTATGDFLIDFPIGDTNVYGNFTEIVWNSGVTEPGSSGSPLLTLAPGGAHYEIRGGLYSGAAACNAQNAPDWYSELGSALPVMRQYLTPDVANPLGLVVATEFYNRTLDHYFLSTNPVEINNLDTGATIGWERTGFRFLVYDNPAPGTSPVCRFYRPPAYGDSHFYSASPTECAANAAAHPVDWLYESPNVFYAQLPDTATGACPAGTRPVYRFFRPATTNHRYTTEIAVRNELAATSGYTAEGYGPGPYYPIMCAAVQ